MYSLDGDLVATQSRKSKGGNILPPENPNQEESVLPT
jgi:hypothetical protein